jgi:tetratricopeptide (TPR) repeat protein
VKVEQAFRLLPPLEALGPLRGLVLASSTPDAGARWGSAAPYLTVGKAQVSVDLLRRGIPQLLHRITEHLTILYEHYADALEHEEEGESMLAVADLLGAARLEERVGRYGPAFQWGEVALAIAEGLNPRRPEIETLIFLGQVGRAQGLYTAAARHYQRALVLAEAESDQGGAIDASEGQGLISLALGEVQGAAAWLGRAERSAEGAGDAPRHARTLRLLAGIALKRGDLDGAATLMQRSRTAVEPLGDSVEMAHTLEAQGQLDAARGDHAAALAAYREALAWEQRAGRDPRIECGIRLRLADLFISLDRMAEGEQEIRQAERLAVAHDLGRRLIQIYTMLGALRGRQGAEMGFVFFEQAMVLSHLLEPAPTLEAEIYHQYGIFKAGFGRAEEARVWLERARELLAAAGGRAALELVDAELSQIAG